MARSHRKERRSLLNLLGTGLQGTLVLLFTSVTALGIGAVYLYVIPELDNQTRVARQRELEVRAKRSIVSTQRAYQLNLDANIIKGSANYAARLSSARVTLIAVPRSRAGPTQGSAPVLVHDSTDVNNEVSPFVGYDKLSPTETLVNEFKLAKLAAAAGKPVRNDLAADRPAFALVGLPIGSDTRFHHIAVFSTSLTDIPITSNQVRRRLLIAGLIGMLVAAVAAMIAAHNIILRVKPMQLAARAVSRGESFPPLSEQHADEIGELARSFNHMQNELTRLENARRDFITTASHELRTPLFSLSGYLELLQDPALEPEVRQEFLATTQAQVMRLSHLAASLLDLSRLDAGVLPVNIEVVDISELLQDLEDEFQPLLAERSNQLTLDVPHYDLNGLCDAERTSQIIRILVDNAITHNPDETRINLAARRQSDKVTVMVSNTGDGIPTERLDLIFDRFHTQGATSGSTGVGLTIARELAHAMDSEIAVASGEGHTTFTVTIPAAVG